MALANYTDLKASVAAWLNRADLTTTIPDFIQLAEQDFNDQLRIAQQETRTPFTINSEFVSVPNDFLETRSFMRAGDPPAALEYLPPDTQTNALSSSGVPRFFSISGSSFRFSPIPDGAYDATLVYYAKVPPLSLNATNWLLTRWPAAYLFGSILSASVYIQNDPRLPTIKAGYDEVIGKMKHSDSRTRWGGNGMMMRAA